MDANEAVTQTQATETTKTTETTKAAETPRAIEPQTTATRSESRSESTRELGFDENQGRSRMQSAPREAREAHAPRSGRDEGIIFVGKKPLMTYVLAVVTQFNAGQNSVKIKARGKAISRVIDVTQVVKSRFMNSLRITNFDAATEVLPNEDGTTSKVSSLTLTLTK